MAIAYVDKGEFTTTSTAQTTFNITRPAATVQNLGALAFVMSTGIVSTPPAGFVSLGGFEATLAIRLEMWWKVTTNSEPATYTFSFGASTRFGCAAILLYSGVDTAALVGGSAGTIDGAVSATAIPCPTLDALDGQMLLASYGISGGATSGPPYNWFTPPAGMSERVDLSATSTTRRSLGVAEQAIASDGATGTKTATASTAGQHVGVSVLLSPPNLASGDLVGMIGG